MNKNTNLKDCLRDTVRYYVEGVNENKTKTINIIYGKTNDFILCRLFQG